MDHAVSDDHRPPDGAATGAATVAGALAVPFEQLVHEVPLGVWVHVGGRVVYANRCAEEMLGAAPGGVVGLDAQALVHPASAELVAHRTGRLLAGQALAGSAEYTVVALDGRHVRVESVETTLALPQGTAVVVSACDVTERARREARLAHLATHDGLTGLPNRLLLTDRLTQALTGAARRGGCVLVTFVDLDRFKAVNDRLGHATGDALLQHVARSLLETAREGDTVARLSGDEFVVCADLDGDVAGTAADAEALLERYRRALRRPFAPAAAVPWSASTGAVVCDGAWTAEHALAEADRRMYAAKHGG